MWAAAVTLILMVPLVAMQFTDEMAWDQTDFIVAGVLLFGTGLAYDLVARKGGTIASRAAVGLALVAALILVWMNLAVGLIGLRTTPPTCCMAGCSSSESSAPSSRASEHGRGKGLLMFGIVFGFGGGLMLFSIATELYLFLVVLAVVSACAMAVDTLYKVLMQENVADEQRGRAMGSWVLSIGVAPVGHLGVGGLAGLMGAPRALLVNGAVLAVISLTTAARLPRIRRLR